MRYIVGGDYKRALRQADIALDRVCDKKESWLDSIARKEDEAEELEKSDEERATENAQFKALDRDGKIAKIIFHIFDGNIAKATEEANALVRQHKDLPEAEFLLAELLERQGETMRAHLCYTNAIGKRLVRRGMRPEFFTESRNQVYILRWELFPSGTVFMKQYSDRQTLRDEWNNSTVFRHAFRGGVQLPLLELSDSNDSILFKAAGEQTLLERIADSPNSEKMRLMRQAAVLLARIHIFGTKLHERGPPPDSTVAELHIDDIVGREKDHFTRKIEDTLFSYYKADPQAEISEEAQDKVLSAHAAINARLTQAPRDFYKDHNPRNVVVDELGDITAIDFESSKLLPCQIDLVSLLEFGQRYVTEQQKQALIDTYIKEKERLLRTSIDKQGFMQTYRYARVQRHLEMVGYRSRDYQLEEDIPKRNAELRRRQCHLRAAAEAIGGLKADESDTRTAKTLAHLHEGVMDMVKGELELGSH
jgi:hypothetical protein